MSSDPPPPHVPDYELLRRIGQGSFGEVWLARSLPLGMLRAVKVVHRAAFEDAADYDRELSGVRNFEPISRAHAGLVDILHVGVNQPGGYFYYAMELADDANPSPDSGCQVPDTRQQPSPADVTPAPLSRQSAISDWQSYSPLTLSARWHAEGRLPLADCLRIGVALTDALEFLHRRGLIHRDIKPSNIIFVEGEPKLADVGTVARVEEARTMVGTEGFQAPEGPGKPQADLFSLGKVLYEISTGKDRQRFPEPLTKLADLPDREKWHEFNAVVDKACQPDPARRYPSTTELRADLVDVQNDRSVRKRWLREKRFKQAAWLVAVLAVLAAIAFILYIQQLRLRLATDRTAKAEQATLTERLEGEERQRNEAEKGRALLQLEQAIRPPHGTGWSSNAWFIASNATEKFGPQPTIQSQAAASLASDDVRLLRPFLTNSSSSVTFDGQGRRLLIGGHFTNSTTLWDSATGEFVRLDCNRPGPVCFGPAGDLWQFHQDGPCEFVLRDLPSQQVLRRFSMPVEPTRVLPGWTNVTLMALTPDGAVAAAAVMLTDRADTPHHTNVVAVWETATGRELLRREQPANALALAPDGSLLAVGDIEGRITVWSLDSGSNQVLQALDRPASMSLAFRRDILEGQTNSGPFANRLLAAGDASGNAVVWDVTAGVPRSVCRGGSYKVSQLAFSPDGTVLIAADLSTVRFWDWANQRQILSWGSGVSPTGLALSPDGTRLAVSTQGQIRWAGGQTYIWQWEFGRGIFTLRGLSQRISRTRFSPDSQFLAALAINWQLAVWDTATGRLLHLFNVPRGITADNAAIRFSADGRYLAFATSGGARLWDLDADGKMVGEWPLRPGLQDSLGFDAEGRLLLFRAERQAESHWPQASEDYRRTPWVCRVRDLRAPDWTNAIFAFTNLNQAIAYAEITPDTRTVVALGIEASAVRTQFWARAYSLQTGEQLWEKRVDRPWLAGFSMDTAGHRVVISTNSAEQPTQSIFEVESGAEVAPPIEGEHLLAAADGMRIWASAVVRPRGGQDYAIMVPERKQPLVVLGIQAHPQQAEFDPTGNLFAIGDESGTVLLHNLREINNRLSKIKLGW